MSAGSINDFNGSSQSCNDALKNEEQAQERVDKPQFTTQVLKISSMDDMVPENFSSGGIVRIRDLIDRRDDYIGINRMRVHGLTGFPEKNLTHVYIWFRHFFELSKLMDDAIKSEIFHPNTTKWIKFVNCHWERDMYMRERVHTDRDIYLKDCSRCRKYVNDLKHKSIWWFSIGDEDKKFLRMTFTNFYNDNITFECCYFWIKIVGTLEVELKLEDAGEGETIRRNYRAMSAAGSINAFKGSSQSCIDALKNEEQAQERVEKPQFFTQVLKPLGIDDHKAINFREEGGILLSTNFLLQSLHETTFSIETTYKCIASHPVSVFGTINWKGSFNAVGVAITKGPDFDFIFKTLMDNVADWKPDTLICTETTPEIRIACNKRFGETTIIDSANNGIEAIITKIRGLDTIAKIRDWVEDFSKSSFLERLNASESEKATFFKNLIKIY